MTILYDSAMYDNELGNIVVRLRDETSNYIIITLDNIEIEYMDKNIFRIYIHDNEESNKLPEISFSNIDTYIKYDRRNKKKYIVVESVLEENYTKYDFFDTTSCCILFSHIECQQHEVKIYLLSYNNSRS